MASQLGYSLIEDTNNTNNSNNEVISKRRNKTLKKRTQVNNEKVESFLNSMNDETGDDLANFTPPNNERFKKPKMDKISKPNDPRKPPGVGIPFIPAEMQEEVKNSKDPPVNFEAFSDLKTKKYKSYYNNYIPYYDNPSNTKSGFGNKDELMKKLNYVIHMMEEQKDEKTKNVTEELVLYLFLGVFIIFTVDSFARASKYTR
jgi:hypothetical protein